MLRFLVTLSRLRLQAGISLISLLSCSATLWLTLSFCWHLWPPEKRPLAVLIGVVWELAKLIFMTQGLHQTRGHTLAQRLGGLLLIAVSILASAGSVGASAGFMQQRRASDQQRIVTSSRQYNSAHVDITALDEHIALLTDTARRQTAQNFLTRAQKTSDAITELRAQRQRAAATLESLESNAVPQISEASTLTAGFLNNTHGAVPPTLLHVFVSVMLEMFGFAAMLLLHGEVSTTRASRETTLSAPPPHRPRHRRSKLHTRDANDGKHENPEVAFDASQVQKTPPPHLLNRSKQVSNAPDIYKPTQLTQSRLTTLNGSRRYRACRDLLHAFGQHCLRIGRDDATLTTTEIRIDLCEGMDWRTVRGYLRLLTNAGVLLASDRTRIRIADFARANASDRANFRTTNSKDCTVKVQSLRAPLRVPAKPAQEDQAPHKPRPPASRCAPQLSLLPFRPSCI